MKRKFNTAVVGLGNIGFQFDFDSKRQFTWSHVSAYNKCVKTELAAVVEIDQEKIRKFSSFYPDIPVYDSLNCLLQKHDIDVVSICTPTHTHYDLVLECLNFPVRAIFCEKPFAADAGKCAKLYAKANEKSIFLAVNHTRRWEAPYLFAAQRISEKEIGDITSVHAYYPGQIYNIGTHLYDTIRMLTGANPKKVSGLYSKKALDPSISGIIAFDHFNCTILATGKREDLIFEVDVIGDKGRIKIEKNGSKVKWYKFIESRNYSGYRELVPVKVEKQLSNDRLLDAICNIADCIEGNTKNVNCTAADGFWSVSIAEAFLTSARNEGAYVVLKDPEQMFCEGKTDGKDAQSH